MSGDYSRKTFNPGNNYNGVFMQQGRVQLDADWNEQVQIDERRRRVQTLDTLGHAVVPRSTVHGFQIELPGNSSMLIHPGRMYVDGLLAENRGTNPRYNAVLEEMFGQDAIPYEDQPYFRDAAAYEPLPTTGTHLVYLKIWQRELTAVNEPKLVEKALGVDTTTRTQTAWQVRVLPLGNTTSPACRDSFPEWDDLIASSAGRMSCDSEPADDDTAPCAIPISHGYRGLENRLYRVAVHDGGDLTTATFKWARDNGSVESRVTAINGTTITIQQSQWDNYRRFEIGKWVEITDDVREWRNLPGEMRRIEDIDYPTNTLTLNDSLPAADFPTTEYATREYRNTRVRRWDQATDLAGGGLLPMDGTVRNLELGIQVQFSLDPDIANGVFKSGDYWLIAARAVDGTVDSYTDKPPFGILYHYARLALVSFPNTLLDDCREYWPLETCQSCCTVTVGDGITSQGDVGTIRQALALIPEKGGKICLLAGRYEENVVIDGRRNITIEGCGQRSVITSLPPSSRAKGANPVIWIRNSKNIEIKDLRLTAHTTGPGILAEEAAPDPDSIGRVYPLDQITLGGLTVSAATRCGIEVHDATNVRIHQCDIRMEDVPTTWPGIFVTARDCCVEYNKVSLERDEKHTESRQIDGRGGIQVGGNSTQVEIAHNQINGGSGHGITLGSLEVIDQNDRILLARIAMVARPLRECEPCISFDPVVPETVEEIEPPEPGNPLSYGSAGPLEDIGITHNSIQRMGMGGIGMAGFFNINAMTDTILVDRLRIEHNSIHHCLLLPQTEISPNHLHLFSYGAIALSVVQCLHIVNNRLENNGQDISDPVCGIYALHVEGAEISHNRIVDNGARFTNPTEDGRPGRRSGIHLQTVETALDDLLYDDNESHILRQNGTAAAKIHDNTVVQPLGQALYMVARGPVQVTGNILTSRGVMPLQNLTTFSGTVFIVNLGLPEEFLNILTNFAAVTKGKSADFLDTVEPSSYQRTAATLKINPFSGIPIANGNVQFCNNQCSLDLLGTEVTFVWNSILVMSLDDVAFSDNQCECSLDLVRGYDFIALPTFILGLTVRLNGNRFEEGLFNALLSAHSWGLFMHTAVGNQATHCLWLRDAVLPNRTRTSDNIAFLDPNTTNICEALHRG